MTVTEVPLIASPFICRHCGGEYDDDIREPYTYTVETEDDNGNEHAHDITEYVWPCCQWEDLANAFRADTDAFNQAGAIYANEHTGERYGWCEECDQWTELGTWSNTPTDVGGNSRYHWVCDPMDHDYQWLECACEEWTHTGSAYWCESCEETSCGYHYSYNHDHDSEECDCGDNDCSQCVEYERANYSGPTLQWVDDAFDKLNPPGVEMVWTGKFRQHDPVSAASDFYLMEWIIAQSPDRDAAALAHARQDEIVAEFAPIFAQYLDGAVGGELRHHRGNQGNLSGDRSTSAWRDWAYVRHALGDDALVKAEKAFTDDYAWSAGYGGEAWAQVARVLREYLTGKRTSRQFVDNVFSLQHNGGCVLDKVHWAGDCPVRTITDSVGPAHSALQTDVKKLVKYASRRGRVTARSAMLPVNKARRNNGQRLVTLVA